MSEKNGAITLRPVGADDDAFLLKVYSGARAEELSLTGWEESQQKAFLNMQFTAQQQHYRERFPDAAYNIILFNERPVGRIYVERSQSEIRILDIALLPEHRNKGIGGSLLEDLLAEASGTSKPVRIYVETYNRSQSLFERLGFSVIEEDSFNLLLEWRSEARLA